MHSSIAGRRTARTAAAALAAGGVLLAAWTVSPPASDGRTAQRAALCAEADTAVADATRRVLRKAVVCLSNKARAQAGADRVGRNPRLQKAAQRHANAMSKADCLSTRCPGERHLEGRIRKAGYLEGARRWGYAENTGCAVSAGAMIRSWLDSSVHRGNLLAAKFREIGVGVVEKGPRTRCEKGHAVFSAVFAWRTP